MLYGNLAFDPVLIVAQIVSIQCVVYFAFGVILQVLLASYGFPSPSTVSSCFLFDSQYLSPSTPLGLAVLTAHLLAALVGALSLPLLVERAKKCLDFGATFYINHVFICWVYKAWPTGWWWWSVQGGGFAIMTLLGEWLCMRREMAEIPMHALRRPAPVREGMGRPASINVPGRVEAALEEGRASELLAETSARGAGGAIEMLPISTKAGHALPSSGGVGGSFRVPGPTDQTLSAVSRLLVTIPDKVNNAQTGTRNMGGLSTRTGARTPKPFEKDEPA